MSTTIASVLAELRDDHRNIARLLDLIEAELLTVDRGKNPDLELLHDIMQYMIVYSDAIHHPKEDVVYAALRAAGPEHARGLDGVETDHREIAALGQSLRDDIEAMISGAAVTRERVLHDTIDYVRRLRRHMRWEEDDLFPRADALAEARDGTIDIGHLDSTDPVFGATTQAAFNNLLQHLKLAAEAR